jgi:hypothetical protein
VSVAYAIWLPCNRINFFHALEDRALLDLSIKAEADHPNSPAIGFGHDRDYEGLQDAIGDPNPSSSIVRRLLWVIRYKCDLTGSYKLAFGPRYKHPEKIDVHFKLTVEDIYELARKRAIDMRIQQPSHGGHTRSDEQLFSLAEKRSTLKAQLRIHATLTAEGLQTWRATSKTETTTHVDAALRVLQASMMAVNSLDLHSNAVNGRREAQQRSKVDRDRAPSMKAQREPDVWLSREYAGTMPFFQLNILMGGLFYPGFKPDVFFERDPTDKDLQEMNNRTSTKPPVLLNRSGAAQGDSRSMDGRRHHEHMISIEYILDALWCTTYRNGKEDTLEEALARAIDRFLTVTGDRSLLPIKWRVERARRAILVAMLGVVHRKQHLTQLREEQPFPESFDAANEPQLRGYITLVGAKLPLLSNVTTYLEPILDSRALDRDHIKHRNAQDLFAPIRSLAHEWTLLLGAITNNVEGLTQAIESAWQERLLYEQEQTRAEQEAMAEIERARVSSSARTTTVDSLFGAMVLVFTIAAFSGDGSHSETFERDVTLIAFGLAAVSVMWIAYRVRLGRQRRRGADQRHYYEMNLRLDRHTNELCIANLMELDEGHVQRPGSPLVIQRRGSYRVERVSDDEAMHKIHLIALVRLSRGRWRRLIGRPLKVPLSVIYEVLYHMPTLNGELLLREVRMTCYSDEVLTPAELRRLSEAVAIDLIDPFLADTESFSHQVKTGTDPSSALFKQRADGHPQQSIALTAK